MKRFFTLIVGVGVLLIAFSASALTTSSETLAKCQEQFNTAKHAYQKAGAEVNIRFYDGKHADPATYNEMKQIIVDIYKKHGYAADHKQTVNKIYQQAALSYPAFRKEAWAEIVAKKNSKFWLMNFTMYNYVQLAPEERFDILVNVLSDIDFEPGVKYTAIAVEALIKISSNIDDEAKVKASLKRLNRKYTPYLIKDKANWEPIVAQIRTALETY